VFTWYAGLNTSFDPIGGPMTTDREQPGRGARQRAPADKTDQGQLARRRAEMHAAEGHAGSIPRGNQRTEDENVGLHRNEWDRLLGH
jgi:hypothetical protein